MLKMDLTDGVQDVSAIEYKPMRNLNSDITPGCKMLLKGPVTCRRGILLLSEANVELLGGEVEDLVVTGSLSALLASKLGVSPNIAATHQTHQAIEVRNQESTSNSASTSVRQHNINQPANFNQNVTVNQHTTPFNQPSTSTHLNFDQQISNKPVARVTSVQVANNQNNDTFADDDIDFDQLAEIEEQITKKEISNKRPFTKDLMNFTNDVKRPRIQDGADKNIFDVHPDSTSGYPCSEDEDYLREMEISERNLHTSQGKNNTSSNNRDLYTRDTASNSIIDKSKLNRLDSGSMKQSNSLNFRNDVGSKTNSTNNGRKSEIHSSLPVQLNSEPFVYIKQILEMNEIDKIGRVFTIKGQILKLLSKLSVGKDGWSLKCTLIDGTGSIDVDFTNEVLTGIVGYSPEEMIRIRKEIPHKPEMKEKALIALQNAKNKLQVLYCLIELTVIDGVKITNLVEFNESHARSLKERLTDCGF